MIIMICWLPRMSKQIQNLQEEEAPKALVTLVLGADGFSCDASCLNQIQTTSTLDTFRPAKTHFIGLWPATGYCRYSKKMCSSHSKFVSLQVNAAQQGKQILAGKPGRKFGKVKIYVNHCVVRKSCPKISWTWCTSQNRKVVLPPVMRSAAAAWSGRWRRWRKAMHSSFWQKWM